MHGGPVARSRRPKVTVLYKTLPHYRVPFYEQLRQLLDDAGVDLSVVVGTPTSTEATKHDTGVVRGVRQGTCRSLSFAGHEVIWQPGLLTAAGSDLVVVEQASRLLVNYPLLVAHQLGLGAPVALWGHGMNLQRHKAVAFGEQAKRAYSTRVHWWFGYTDATERIVAGLGYPCTRITVVRNATDTRSLRAARDRVGDEDRVRIRRQLGIAADAPVGLVLGSLYDDKRLPFAFEALALLRRQLPHFHLLVVGDGPERPYVEAMARAHPGVHVVGAARGDALAEWGAISDVSLCPGLVGLGVLDSFALRLPVVATAYPYHSPEIDYVEHGVNGLITRHWQEAGAFAADIVRVVQDDAFRRQLVLSAQRSAEALTIEQMAARFADGVVQALAAPVYRGRPVSSGRSCRASTP